MKRHPSPYPRMLHGQHYVYLVAKDELHKIGTTYNLRRRMGELSRRGPATLVHYFLATNGLRVEAALLYRYLSSHVGKEWFRLAPSDVAEICSLAGPYRDASDLPPPFLPVPRGKLGQVPRAMLRKSYTS